MFTHNHRKLIILASLLLAILTFASLALAQTGESPWSEPANLSRSGAATDPYIVVDSAGIIHVLWIDAYDGYIYSFYQDGSWSPPTAVSLPISKDFRVLKFAVDDAGYIHAVWIDSEDTLYYARLTGSRFDSPTGWNTPRALALSAADVDIAAAPDGSIHLAYVRRNSSSDFPAGIYTFSKRSALSNWSLPKFLYTSTFMRGVSPEVANVSIDAADNGLVYIAWDDPQQERIFMVRSADNGNIWEDTTEIDRRRETDSVSSIGPSRALMYASSEDVLLFWGAGHDGAACSQYYISSDDDGQTWSEPDLLPDPFQRSCAEKLQVLGGSERVTWLMAKSPGGIYLLSWDSAAGKGVNWSTPQIQVELNGFTNLETYRPVELACQQAALAGDRLHVVGCQAADVKAERGDIWYLSRTLGDADGFFPTPTPPPIWSTPAVISSSKRELSVPSLISESTLSSGSGLRQHAFWTQSGNNAIYYSLFDGTRWTQPLAVLSSPGGSPGAPSAALTSSGDLFLTWSDLGSGVINYSHVPALGALNKGEWAVTQELPLDNVLPSSPHVQVGSDGHIYIAYAVPLNEGRGVYLIQSQEPFQHGVQIVWSEPELVFNAAIPGLGMVDNPQLTFDRHNLPHVLWTHYSLPPVAEPLGLAYARSLRSTAQGMSDSASAIKWSDPQEVDRGRVLWSQILSASDGTLHRAWQELINGGDQVLWHAFSLDDGASWSEPVSVTGFQRTGGPAGLTLDSDDRLHMLQITTASNNPFALQRWLWEGADKWTPAESQSMPNLLSADSLSPASSYNGHLAALYTGILAAGSDGESQADEQQDGEPANSLFYTDRTLDISGVAPTPQPTFTPAAEGPSGLGETSPGTDSTVSGTPTPTISISTDPGEGMLSGLFSNRWTGIALAALPAIIIVGIAFILGVRKFLSRR
ncbi:MAG: sialidase family protein [Chloroflexota bacterium]|nr:sialidase family protein [Chloroflexota bacterium]